ncbi:type II secretion system protein M [Catenovulum sp. 2E275]|uniref:type II secretion system protein M n=1 Tax=Catenovulum sp. 2E275 TaxID=2980497 RepID=UPI0021CE63F8|nr:type II secretion system protein M [Catenovulum sp. 2E275]MCU4675055.1 type II secretion system protein M [Catenovulum sp. 2E275]
MANNLSSQFKLYSEKFSNLNQREKSFISFASLFAIVFISYTIFIEPNLIKIEQAQLKTQALQTDLAQLSQTADDFRNALQVDINLPLNKKIQELEQRLMQTNSNIAKVSDQLVTAKQMSEMLEAMLSQTDSLKLVQLKSLPTENLLEQVYNNSNSGIATSPDSDFRPENISLYQQGISLTIEGDYQSIYQFLQQAEQLPWHFYWRKFNYKVTQYPLARLEVELITLSLTQGFVGL